MDLTRRAMGFALTVALSACSSPSTPLPLGNEEGRPNPPPPASPTWPPPVVSATGCDLYLLGVVTQGGMTETRAAAEATVTWRHFDGGPFESAHEIRADANGLFNICVPLPSSADCGSGACSVRYEVRARKSGYAANSTSVIADYNHWDHNFFRVPDLELVPE